MAKHKKARDIMHAVKQIEQTDQIDQAPNLSNLAALKADLVKQIVKKTEVKVLASFLSQQDLRLIGALCDIIAAMQIEIEILKNGR